MRNPNLPFKLTKMTSKTSILQNHSAKKDINAYVIVKLMKYPKTYASGVKNVVYFIFDLQNHNADP